MIAQTKRCCHCKQIKSVEEFNHNKTNKDGLTDECRECTHFYNTRVISLDKPRRSLNGHTLGEIYRQPVKTSDTSYEKVFRALSTWIHCKIITKKEAEAIYMHAVEDFSFAEIAKSVECNSRTVFGAYWRGINKLRNAFSGLEMEALNYVKVEVETA